MTPTIQILADAWATHLPLTRLAKESIIKALILKIPLTQLLYDTHTSHTLTIKQFISLQSTGYSLQLTVVKNIICQAQDSASNLQVSQDNAGISILKMERQ